MWVASSFGLFECSEMTKGTLDEAKTMALEKFKKVIDEAFYMLNPSKNEA
jgi:hypothetical protein